MSHKEFITLEDISFQKDGKRSSNKRFNQIIKQLDNNLVYTNYTSASGDSEIFVNAEDLEITGHIAGNELEQLEQIASYDEVLNLRKKVSRAMAKTALKITNEKSVDDEFDYPVFIGIAERADAYFMFRDSNISAMITSRRPNDNDKLMIIESSNIKNRYEQRVLLGGVAALMSALDRRSIN